MARHSSHGTIDIRTEVELRYWAEELGVEPEIVRHAVEAVGTGEMDVRDYVLAYLSGTRLPTGHHHSRTRT